MKVQIKLEYRDKVYLSDVIESNQKELEEVEELMEDISKGKAEHLSFENKNEKYFFSKSVLEQSVITVIVINED